jgi:hypothetical protein
LKFQRYHLFPSFLFRYYFSLWLIHPSTPNIQGFYVTTLLSVLNTNNSFLLPIQESSPEGESFHPERYSRILLSTPSTPPSLATSFSTSPTPASRFPLLVPQDSKVLVSTFGHGRHACPGASFALLITKIVVIQFFLRLKMFPKFGKVFVPETQIGGVGFVALFSVSFLSLFFPSPSFHFVLSFLLITYFPTDEPINNVSSSTSNSD